MSTHIVSMFIILVLSLALLLSGCTDSSKDDKEYSDNNVGSISNFWDINRANEIGSQPVFDIPHREKAKNLFPDVAGYLDRIETYENGVFLYLPPIYEQGTRGEFVFCNLDDRSVVLRYSAPENFIVYNFSVFNDGSLLVVGYPIEYDGLGGFAYSDGQQILHITEERTSLLYCFTDNASIGPFRSLVINEEEGYIYIHIYKGYDAILIISFEGQLINEIETDYMLTNIVFSKCDNVLYITEYDGVDMIICALDSKYGVLSEVMRKTYNSNWVVHPSKKYSLLVETDFGKVYGVDVSKKSFTELFDLTKQGISGWIPFIYEYSESYIAYVSNINSGKQEILGFSALEDYNGPVETLRLGKFEKGKDFLLDEMIADFNFYKPQYYIELIDYSKYNDEAVSRLNTDILNGTAPDILLMSAPITQENYLPIQRYIANNAILDIMPYMARDLSVDSYWSNAMNTLMTGNSCYIAVPAFSMFGGIIGKSSAVNNLNYQDAQEFYEYLKADFSKQAPLMTVSMTRERFATEMILANMELFVDYNTGTASFESDVFIALLEASKALAIPKEQYPSSIIDLISLARTESQMTFYKISSIYDFDVYAHALYGDYDTSYFPAINNDGGVALIPQYIFGISSASKNIEGAWAFLRMLYEYDNLHTLTGISFPMNKASYATQADAYVISSEEWLTQGMGGYFFSNPDGDVLVPPIDTKVVSKIAIQTEELINKIDRLYLVDTDLMNVIYEELPSFFANHKSAEEISHTIQNRIQTYLWEMR